MFSLDGKLCLCILLFPSGKNDDNQTLNTVNSFNSLNKSRNVNAQISTQLKTTWNGLIQWSNTYADSFRKLKFSRKEGVVEIFWNHWVGRGVVFVAWQQLSWWCHTQRQQVTQVNSVSRQHGQKLTASSSTSGEQRRSFSETCPGLHHLLLTSSVILLLYC